RGFSRRVSARGTAGDADGPPLWGSGRVAAQVHVAPMSVAAPLVSRAFDCAVDGDEWTARVEATKALHLTGPALRLFETSRSLQPARQVNAVVRVTARHPPRSEVVSRGLLRAACPARGDANCGMDVTGRAFARRHVIPQLAVTRRVRWITRSTNTSTGSRHGPRVAPPR